MFYKRGVNNRLVAKVYLRAIYTKDLRMSATSCYCRFFYIISSCYSSQLLHHIRVLQWAVFLKWFFAIGGFSYSPMHLGNLNKDFILIQFVGLNGIFFCLALHQHRLYCWLYAPKAIAVGTIIWDSTFKFRVHAPYFRTYSTRFSSCLVNHPQLQGPRFTASGRLNWPECFA